MGRKTDIVVIGSQSVRKKSILSVNCQSDFYKVVGNPKRKKRKEKKRKRIKKKGKRGGKLTISESPTEQGDHDEQIPL